MKDEQIWIQFAAAALAGQMTDSEQTVSEDDDLAADAAADAADKLLRQLRIRRAVERDVVESVPPQSPEQKEGNG